MKSCLVIALFVRRRAAATGGSPCEETRRGIESLGAVNPQAFEEHEEATQRQEFLTVQRQDLPESIRDTETAIHEIDEVSRTRFTEAFKAINENFSAGFRTMFGGGTGEMRLTDESNAIESGIDIIASPQGKKLQNMLLLSGGEKALTPLFTTCMRSMSPPETNASVRPA